MENHFEFLCVLLQQSLCVHYVTLQHNTMYTIAHKVGIFVTYT